MDAVGSHFDAERAESVFFMLAGALTLCISVYFFVARHPRFYKGLALPLIAVGLIQFTVGATIFVRSPQDDARVHAALRSDRVQIAAVELPRMKAVTRNVVVYRWIELALALVGAALILVAGRRTALRSAGLGLAIQAALMLVLDQFAHARAEVYLNLLTAS